MTEEQVRAAFAAAASEAAKNEAYREKMRKEAEEKEARRKEREKEPRPSTSRDTLTADKDPEQPGGSSVEPRRQPGAQSQQPGASNVPPSQPGSETSRQARAQRDSVIELSDSPESPREHFLDRSHSVIIPLTPRKTNDGDTTKVPTELSPKATCPESETLYEAMFSKKKTTRDQWKEEQVVEPNTENYANQCLDLLAKKEKKLDIMDKIVLNSLATILKNQFTMAHRVIEIEYRLEAIDGAQDFDLRNKLKEAEAANNRSRRIRVSFGELNSVVPRWYQLYCFRKRLTSRRMYSRK